MYGLEHCRVREALEFGNFIFIKANFLRTKALIDTGAQKSCISENFSRKLHLLPNGPAESKFLLTADGKPIPVQGTVEVSIKIQGLSIPFTFHVLRGLNHNMILGVDFLSATKANIDMSNGVIVLCDDLVTLSLARPDDCVLRPIAEIDIPGQSEALIPVQLSRDLTAENAVIEPYPFSRKNFVVARSIVKSDGKLTMCKLLNPTKDVIHLNKGDTIAKISAIPSNFICEIAESFEKSPPPTSLLIPIEKCKHALFHIYKLYNKSAVVL